MKHKVISLLLVAAITISLLPFMAKDASAAGAPLPPDDGHILWLENASKNSEGEYVIRKELAYHICGLVPDNPSFVGLVLAEQGTFNPRTWQYANFSNVLANPYVIITPSQDDSKKFSIRSTSLDNRISFGSLKPGKYTLYLYALANGAADSYTPCIDSIDIVITSVGTDISGFAKTLTYGKSYGVPGTINSKEGISKVVAAVIDPKVGTPTFYRSNFYVNGTLMSGRAVSATWNSPSGKSLKLSGSPIDNNIYFAGLARGNYIFRVTVYLKSGTYISVEKPFTVK